MTSNSDPKEKRPRPDDPKTIDSLADGSKPPMTSQSLVPTDSIQAPVTSDAEPQYTGQEPRGGEETSVHTAITNIRVTDAILGFRRFPVGFYAIVCHSGLKWRTENKPSSAKDDVIEWSGLIPVPSDPSTTVCLEVYASFEFQPTLGTGEQLRKLTIAVKQLLDHSEKRVPFSFFPKDGDSVSPCSSILVTTEWCNGESNDALAARMLGPIRSIINTPNELEDATNHGHNALSLYRKHGRKIDLEDSVAQFELAFNRCPLDHPCRAAAESNLATAKFILYQIGDTDTFFEVPLTLYRNALTTRPVGHADRLFTLIRLAAVHLARFEKQRNEADGAQVEALLYEAMDLRTTGSHENRDVSFMLRLYAGLRVGPNYASRQLSIDSLLGSRLTDEDLGVVSVQLLGRFKRYGDLADLEQAIALLQTLVGPTSVWGERYCRSLGNLGAALSWRFDHLGELSDLEVAISTQRHAVHLTPDGHPDKPGRLNNLGLSLRTRFGRFGKLSDLEDAISRHRNAVLLVPDGHPNKPGHLSNLGNSLMIRFNRLGELSNLEDAISTHSDAAHLIPDGHPDKPGCLNNLGLSLMTRFNRLGKLSDLEDAISTHRRAVHLTPDGHPDKSHHLDNLGVSFITRFNRLGELSDLEDAILTHRHAVHLTLNDHSGKSHRLNNLGVSFITRFERLGKLGDLEDAISTYRHALHLIPDGHPDKLRCLNNLGRSFRARFNRLGELGDLEDAISTHRYTVHLTPDDHPDKPIFLNNLGLSFIVRFNRLGELSDLEDAISTHRDAVHLTPDGHPDKLAFLSDLGNSFTTRFNHLEELSDLEDAISTQRHVVHLTPDGHPDKLSYLNNLGLSLRARFDRTGDLSNLEDAILTHRHAVHLIPDGHPDKPACLGNLGNSFITRFNRLGELSDLEDAILIHRNAVLFTPDGHPNKPGHLNSLGNSFVTRFHCLGEPSDLEDAISTHRDAVHLTPDGHPDKPGRLNNLGLSLRTRFDRLGELSDLAHAISMYSHSASFPIGPIRVRFRASQNWILCARRMRHPSLLRAYAIAINLLPQLAWIGLSLTHRYTELKQGANVAREAAAAALDSGFPELAVEWLEQGRSIVWGELLRLRSSYEQLSSAHPELARKLQELSAALDDTGAIRERAFSAVVDQTREMSVILEHTTATDPGSFSSPLETTQTTINRSRDSLQEVATRHRTLAIERDKVLQEVRRLPGFERFLFPKDFSQLRASAHSGPVVMLNAAESRCDALIVLAGVDHVVHAPLPDFDIQRSTQLQGVLKSFLRQVFVARDGKSERWDRGTWQSFLSPLWKCIVKPVMDALAFSIPGELSRIFWCPTGPFVFLPLHAAGFYDTEYSIPGHKIFDFVVSSYAPTLSILAPARDIRVAPSDDFQLLAVRQPSSDGQSHLPGVHTELEHIKDVLRNSPSARTVLLESSAGTVEEVLGMMKESDWVHFACHGIQDAGNPTDSGLCLANGRRLKISDIIGLSRSRGGLAFLSACQTAKGDEGLSDEAVHIAAGMLFAGYGGVIGTMWSISDRLAPIVARDVYEHLFRDGTRPDYREAARALHDAIRYLRESGEAPFNEWVPFIHVGL